MLFDRSCFDQYEPHKFSTDASTLRLAPGQFPRWFKVDRDMGNGMAFNLVSASEGVYRYKQDLGCVTVVIFND